MNLSLRKQGIAIALLLTTTFVFAQRPNPATEPYRSGLFAQKAATVSTFESISLELPFHGDANRNAFCDVRFRPEGDTAWRQGLRLFTDHITPKKVFAAA